MDDERKAWEKQFSSNFGPREYLRFSAAFVGWILLGAFLAAFLRFEAVFYLFLFSAFAFPFVTRSWRPAYRFLRIILGNNDLPQEPMPRSGAKPPRLPRPWWSFLPGLWFWFLTLLVFYLAIRYYLK